MTKRQLCLKILLALLAVILNNTSVAAGDKQQYTFAWPYAAGSGMAPRGGNSKGPAIVLNNAESTAWRSLTDESLSGFERDRLAILAMAGPYRASFDFLETHGFNASYKPQRPYQSWGTEYVYVVRDEPTYISLQHILVMVIKTPDGSLSEPHVVKHWRQDWRYQDRDMHEYQGHQRWKHRRLSRRQAKNAWSQTVYQVDDSPRYESFGKWSHSYGYSTWISADTWRPLPRREFSVRDDYQVLVGTNRHTITPTGWIHEEANRKVVLDASGQVQSTLAVESGFNRYQRIQDFDFSAGDEYWRRTGDFWGEVRGAWEDVYARESSFEVRTMAQEKMLFSQMFAAANDLQGQPTDVMRSKIVAILDQHLQPEAN